MREYEGSLVDTIWKKKNGDEWLVGVELQHSYTYWTPFVEEDDKAINDSCQKRWKEVCEGQNQELL